MNKFTRVLFVGALVIVASCGESSPSPDNEESTISKIVTAACIDLSNATTDAEAAQALSGAMQLSESIGVSNIAPSSLFGRNQQCARTALTNYDFSASMISGLITLTVSLVRGVVSITVAIIRMIASIFRV